MPTKRINYKLCCGSKALIFEIEKPIRKSQIDIFKQNDYSIPDAYLNSGIFYVKKGNLIATCAYGTTKVQVRVSGNVSETEINLFQEILEKAIGVK